MSSPERPDPTPGEVWRRLDDLVHRLDRLALSLEEGYVRKDVQEARELATTMQMKGIEDEVHRHGKRLDEMTTQRNTDRRLLYTLVVTVFLGPMVVAGLLHALKIA